MFHSVYQYRKRINWKTYLFLIQNPENTAETKAVKEHTIV